MASRIFPIEQDWPSLAATVIFQVRLPRVLLAFFVGSGLSVSGASLQGIFQNPLVSPDILGVAAASGFGAALAILYTTNTFIIQVSAFAFGILGVFLAYRISRVYKTTPVLMLVLSGIVVGAFFTALISCTKYVADPYTKLPAITFFLMGSFSSASLTNTLVVIGVIALGSAGLMMVRWRLNIMAMGDEEARSLGIKVQTIKIIVIVCTTIIIAAAVSIAGMIGWVGLIIPHVGRMFVGPDHKLLLPACLSIGASYLIIMDDLARSIAPMEIPIGILTAIVGAPFFAYLIRRTKGGWR